MATAGPFSPGACDCHVHVIGPFTRFPQVSGRAYTAAPASLEQLQSVSNPLGVTRYVLVQPSFYGADNTCLREALRTLGERGRAVIVVDPENFDRGLLRDFHLLGARGVRVNVYSKFSPVGRDQFGLTVARLAETLPSGEWHIEIAAPLSVLAACCRAIAGSELPIVIAHYGLGGGLSPETPAGRCLLELLTMPHVWIKCSAPYRLSADALATRPPLAWLRAFLRVAPDRCLWGSDWPHTPPLEQQSGRESMVPYRPIAYSRLLSHFAEALPDKDTLHRILVANPERLYGFAPGGDA